MVPAGGRPPKRDKPRMTEVRARLIAQGNIAPQNPDEVQAAREFLARLKEREQQRTTDSISRRSPPRQLKKYGVLPDVNRWLRVTENLCLARLKTTVTILPPEKSYENAQEVEMDLIVEFNPNTNFPSGVKERPLYSQTADGQHQVRMVGYGVGNLSLNVKRIYKGEKPSQTYFPAVVTPWKDFKGSKKVSRD